MPRASARAAACLLVLAACSGSDDLPFYRGETIDAAPFTVVPAHQSMYGGELTLVGDFAAVGDPSEITIGGIHALPVRNDAGKIVVTSQGAPSPGAVDVIVTGSGGRLVAKKALVFDAAPKGLPPKWIAFGASLTAGAQSGGIDWTSQEVGPAAQAARAAGVYLALPLLRSFAGPLQPSDFDPGTCRQKPGTGIDAAGVLDAITDPNTGIDVRLARLDPSLDARNVAVPGAKVVEVLKGAHGGPEEILEHMLEPLDGTDPSDIFHAVNEPQIAHVERIDADIGICVDLLANDLDPAVVASDDLHPELMTKQAVIEPQLAELAMRLGKLHGHYFLANLPSLTFVPNVADLRAKRLASGADTEASFDAKVKSIEDATAAFNDALKKAVAPYPNLHLVDFASEVDRDKAGVDVGGEHLTVTKFGGLLSLDFLHFSATGYALLSNVFLAEIENVLGTPVPRVDIEAVHAADPLAPAKLRAAGLDCPKSG